MPQVINENTSEVLYVGSYSDCDCYMGENDLRDFDNIYIDETDLLDTTEDE